MYVYDAVSLSFAKAVEKNTYEVYVLYRFIVMVMIISGLLNNMEVSNLSNLLNI